MSLPRRIALNQDYLTEHTFRNGFRNFFSPLQIEPPAALETLRFNPVEVAAMDLAANSETVIPEVKGKSMEIEAVIDPKNAREVELRVLRSPDGKERQCLAIRAYPTREDSSGISLFARGSEAELVSLRAWQMRSIWPELKSREGN